MQLETIYLIRDTETGKIWAPYGRANKCAWTTKNGAVNAWVLHEGNGAGSFAKQTRYELEEVR